MGSSLRETTRVITGNAAPRKPLAGAEQQRSTLMRLTQALQRSLQLDELITTFIEHVGEILSLDGHRYQHPQLDLIIGSERQGMHQAAYNLSIETDTLGSLALTRGKPFSEPELASLENLLSALVYPLRNALEYLKAIRAANTDALTQCGNRQAMDETLQREINLSRRYDAPFSVIMFDIDFFKEINDSHGHIMGDQVLQGIAETVRQQLRVADLMFRYGGDEFTVVLHRTPEAQAKLVAEKIRRAVAEQVFEQGENKVQVNLSLGVTQFDEEDSINTLCARVDSALYTAKALGRDQVVGA